MGSSSHELRLYGHRGASARLPENTLEAFERALDDGANALELDVHRTADGALVAIHDRDGRRIAGIARRIGEVALADVKRWNAAAGRPGTRCTVPTLDEVLERFPRTAISVDLKPRDPTVADALLLLADRHSAATRITAGSFHAAVIGRLRRLGWSGPTALTRPEVAALRLLPATVGRRLVHGQAALIPRRGWGVRLDGARFIARCRGLDLRVDFWVVNRPDQARLLLRRGATGIVTDDPGAIAPVIREMEASRGAG